jgi:endonuclease/exonuclease/phosphatase family metal-dependent hydrolase
VQLTIATFNIYKHEDFEQRLPLVLRTLRDAPADVVCLQEAPPGEGRAAAFAAELGYAHSTEVAFARPDDGWSEALAMLSKLPIAESEPIELRPGVANCLRVRLQGADGVAIDVYMTHLHPRDSGLRQREAALILEAMERAPETPAVLCGDFNAVPDGKTMAVLWPRLRSAYEMANGRHPETTFPTPLRPFAGRQAGFSERREAPPTEDESEAKAAIDYVLVRPSQFRALDARVIGEAIEGGWPSDHYGVWVRLETVGD